MKTSQAGFDVSEPKPVDNKKTFNTLNVTKIFFELTAKICQVGGKWHSQC
ncbi:hypothetical protein [Hydrogenovibrio sp. JE_KL2]|nr:hypothetical protein [Hydrogenovibrio sp. JE_KL2]